jgi:hypothetical protein
MRLRLSEIVRICELEFEDAEFREDYRRIPMLDEVEDKIMRKLMKECRGSENPANLRKLVRECYSRYYPAGVLHASDL